MSLSLLASSAASAGVGGFCPAPSLVFFSISSPFFLNVWLQLRLLCSGVPALHARTKPHSPRNNAMDAQTPRPTFSPCLSRKSFTLVISIFFNINRSSATLLHAGYFVLCLLLFLIRWGARGIALIQ